MVGLVDRYGRVHYRWLNRLPLDDRLDGLMHVVVAMLTADGGQGRLRVLSCTACTLVLELCCFLLQSRFYTAGVTVVVLTMLHGSSIVVVFFRENSLILDGLDRGVVVW